MFTNRRMNATVLAFIVVLIGSQAAWAINGSAAQSELEAPPPRVQTNTQLQ
jgi:hypothetical protein